jgi:hypothetical protein
MRPIFIFTLVILIVRARYTKVVVLKFLICPISAKILGLSVSALFNYLCYVYAALNSKPHLTYLLPLPVPIVKEM